jgi:hypothetical protein
MAARHALPLLAVVAAVAAPAPAASAAPTAGAARACASKDLRYPFEPGGPKTFGVFALTARGTTCPTAHRLARTWQARFEHDLMRGRLRFPKRIEGYRFRRLPVHAAQTYTLRGTKGARRVQFDYAVPNG